jgi:hypothetical protein
LKKNYLLLSVLVFASFPHLLKAYTDFIEEGKSKFSFFYNQSLSSSYFDKSGKIIKQIPNDLSYTKKLFDYSQYGVELNFEHAINNKMIIGIDIPINYFNLTNKINILETNQTFEQSFSITKIQYFNLNLKYKIFEKNRNKTKTIAFLISELHIPSGFQKSIFDSSHTFLDDGFFEGLLGLGILVNMEKSYFEATGQFCFRDEEPKDYFKSHIELGIETVPDTKFFIQANIVQTLSNFKYASDFNMMRTQIQENYINAGFGFELFFNNIKAGFQYNIVITGRNTWNCGNLNFNTSFYF